MEKLNPLVDFAFKKLFGVDENKDILIDLINAVVSKQDQIVDLEIKNPYNEKLQIISDVDSSVLKDKIELMLRDQTQLKLSSHSTSRSVEKI